MQRIGGLSREVNKYWWSSYRVKIPNRAHQYWLRLLLCKIPNRAPWVFNTCLAKAYNTKPKKEFTFWIQKRYMLFVVSSHMQVINQAVARGMYSSYCATAKASQQRQYIGSMLLFFVNHSHSLLRLQACCICTLSLVFISVWVILFSYSTRQLPISQGKVALKWGELQMEGIVMKLNAKCRSLQESS